MAEAAILDDAQVHYELFIRRRIDASWTLELAAEDRTRVLERAAEMLEDGEAVAVRVTKEKLNAETRAFISSTILQQGPPEPLHRRRRDHVEIAARCVSPPDLYTAPGREKIGRLLDGWLRRHRATPFELLHRADLAEKLDASGLELQHAIQKVAIPEAQDRDIGVHEVIRGYQGLVDRAIARVMRDARAGLFEPLAPDAFAKAVRALLDEPEPAYRLGGGVAAAIASATTWPDKVDRLLALAEAAPEEGAARRLALAVLEQPLAEIIGSRCGFADLTRGQQDLGCDLLVLTRLAAPLETAVLIDADPSAARLFPPLSGPMERLADWMGREPFEDLRSAMGKRVLAELHGPRRLRPTDAEGEIAVLRVLAMALMASSGRLLAPEEVHAAFVHRSAAITSSDFVERFLDGRQSALFEAQALVRLAENVVGGVGKRAAGRWIAATVGALRFETELRRGPDSPPAKLALLAQLQRAVLGADLPEIERRTVADRIGDTAGLVEGDARLLALMAHAHAPLPHRLQLLLQMACGETAPLGPVAERARAEVLRLMREPAARAELANASQPMLDRLRTMMQATGLAA